MIKELKRYQCSSCNTYYTKWEGRCDACGEWNTIEEASSNISAIEKITSKNKINSVNKISFQTLTSDTNIPERISTGFKEFDKVCGGGIVRGSTILLGGEPGIGKSTLVLQVSSFLSNKYQCMYISGEESVHQIQNRANRLNIEKDNNLKLATETSLMNIIHSLEQSPKTPDILIIDSIQTVHLSTVSGIPGSISQVRSCSQEIISICKKLNIALIIIGHVTREGQIAGPKTLEHMVDAVLYFEGDNANQFRIIRAVKNRFGASEEIGVFQMEEKGLTEVLNPSSMFLNDYQNNVSGASVFAGVEGTRSMLFEVQSLVVDSNFSTPRRSVIGCDSNRLMMILAVLETRGRLLFNQKDTYINITGGLKITDAAADLAIAASLLSSYYETQLPENSVFIGEISLSGMIRNSLYIKKRINEAVNLGFTNIYLPKSSISDNIKNINAANLLPINHIFDLITLIKSSD